MQAKLKIIDIINLPKEIIPESDIYFSINKQDFLYNKIINKDIELGNIQFLEIELKRNSPRITIASSKIEINKYLYKKLSAITNWFTLSYSNQIKNEDNIKIKIELSFKKNNHRKYQKLIQTNSFKKLNNSTNKTPNDKNNIYKSKIRHYSTKEEKYSMKNYFSIFPNKINQKKSSNLNGKQFINKSFGNSENENLILQRDLSEETLSSKRNFLNNKSNKINSLTNSITKKPKIRKGERKFSTEEKFPRLLNFEKEILKQNLFNINETFINDFETEEIIPYLENDLFTLDGDEQINNTENLSAKNIFFNIKNDFEIFYTQEYLNSLELNNYSLKLECNLCIEKAIDIILAYHNARKSIILKRKKYYKVLKLFIDKLKEIRKKKIKRDNLIISKEDNKLMFCNFKEIKGINNEIFKNNYKIEFNFLKQFFQNKDLLNEYKKENILQIFKQIYLDNMNILVKNEKATKIMEKYFKDIKLILERNKIKNLYKLKFNNKKHRTSSHERHNSYSNKIINLEQNTKKNFKNQINHNTKSLNHNDF